MAKRRTSPKGAATEKDEAAEHARPAGQPADLLCQDEGRLWCRRCFGRQLQALTMTGKIVLCGGGGDGVLRVQIDRRLTVRPLSLSSWPAWLPAPSTPASTGHRCAGCLAKLVVFYRVLCEELRGADEVRAMCERWRAAALAVNDHLAGRDQQNWSPVRKAIHDRADAALQAAYAEPSTLMARTIWARQLPLFHHAMGLVRPGQQVRLADLWPEHLRALARELRQASDLACLNDLTFGAVVQAAAKDPYNIPARLALVCLYQQGQRMAPPMGYRELARVLIEHEAVDALWGGDHVALADSIKEAVSTYRCLGDVKARPPDF